MRRIRIAAASMMVAGGLIAAVAAPAVASTDSNFPEINPVGGPTACNAIASGGSVGTGSTTGLANKGALYADACLGAP